MCRYLNCKSHVHLVVLRKTNAKAKNEHNFGLKNLRNWRLPFHPRTVTTIREFLVIDVLSISRDRCAFDILVIDVLSI